MVPLKYHDLSNLGSQCVKKVVLDSPGIVDFVIRLVNSVLNLSNVQLKVFGKLSSTARQFV